MNKPPHFILLILACFLAACTPAVATGNPVPPVSPPARPDLHATPSVMACTLLHSPATPVALGAQFGDRGHISGPADAPVTIVMFSDYQCPACAILAASLKQIRLTHAANVRFVFVNTPQSARDKDTLATQAVEAADLQGKFWEMHDLLFDRQADWSALTPAAFPAWLVKQAGSLGLDPARFQADMNGKQVTDRLTLILQKASGQTVLPPVFFVNGTSPYTGLSDFASLDSVVRMEALTAIQFSNCPSWVIDTFKQYIATLHTSQGDVVIQLLPDKAPQAVNNFVSLARSGWYDGTTFFRVLPGLLAMTGDPSETGMGNAGYLFQTEITSSMRFDQPGMVAMDNSGPDTNGSRFFITLAPAAQLYGQYTIFGKVLSGLDVLAKLTPRNPKPGMVLSPGDLLNSVTIEER